MCDTSFKRYAKIVTFRDSTVHIMVLLRVSYRIFFWEGGEEFRKEGGATHLFDHTHLINNLCRV